MDNDKKIDKAQDKKKINNDKSKLTTRSLTFFKEHKAEFDKIIWPSRKDLIKQTITVIVTSAVFAVIIFVMDTVFQLIYGLVNGIVL